MEPLVDALSPLSPSTALAPVDLPQLLRLSGMTKALLAEVAEVNMDDAARARLALIQERAVVAIGRGLPPDLVQELSDLSVPPSVAPSDGELRVVQAQLVGWLNGLFQAFQVAAVERQLQLAAPGADEPADEARDDAPILSARTFASGPYL